MARRTIRDCVMCGIPGCVHCTRTEYSCDECGSEDVFCTVDETNEIDLCEECFQKLIKSQWEEKSIEEKKEILSSWLEPEDMPEDYDEIFNDLSYCEQADTLRQYYDPF